ncbi:hypothetical protein [Sulfuriroseicoccus oceanibius]|uniref:Uncharacterized protein n=1 Tax=Sulfuriroseicoccus oceanibius TaxID=2707525 RepID=A0A6B3LF42_9BACT|nr:hypothetical protein [Sulfuriroseicoccus oceanibius]QQL45775.1 hypothetical protein G3M56_004100 [Sulfuriroseicoccus oceanibius]
MLKKSLAAIAAASIALSPAIAAPVDAQPMTQQEVTELSVDASSDQSAAAEAEEGGLLGRLDNLIILAAAVAVLYYVYKDNK